MKSVFLSYSHQDETIAERIRGDLNKIDFRVLYDFYDFKLGEDINEEVFSSIKKSKFIIILVSNESINSEWIFNVARKSTEEKKEILLILLESIKIPEGFKHYNAFDFSEQYSKGFAKLQQYLKVKIPNPNGRDGIDDQVTNRDLLGRNLLIKELGDFYLEYSEEKNFPFYLGIFARWGMGKSSTIELLSDYIEKHKHKSKKNEYLICKIDCSLFHKKEKLWITILNRLLNEISRKKIFNFKVFSFKTHFFFYNLLSWGKKRKFLIVSLILLSLGTLYAIFTKNKIPHIPVPADYKETVSLITVLTLLCTLIKTRASIFKQNVFLQDNRNEESSFIRSVNEYKQLITLMNKSKKKKDLKILLVLDEMDRMHKDLLPDIIELIKLFKGLNNEQKETVDKSIISFIFSFNHDIMFPIIGKDLSLNDKQLFLNSHRSYEGYIDGEGKDAQLNYYKLGKEFMDKYLDLSIYLEEEIDYTKLLDELFKGFVESSTVTVKSKEPIADQYIYKDQMIMEKKIDRMLQASSNSKKESSSFTTLDSIIIKDTIKEYASNIETRKVKRLINAVIMLKKLNRQIDISTNEEYEAELKEFILNFLEIKQDKKHSISNSNSAKEEVASTIESFSKDGLGDLKNKSNRQLKFTEYFIHNKIS
ncbi:TIR domain-containing protein [Priestia megaterium]|uniref:TIR domain-containing protein n=1 Tax=Priestia megaterium TaxID=1404 RepID=UPI0039F6C3BB